MLSQKAKYGVRALLHLARQAQAGPILSRTIAEQESIPPKFLESILGELKAAGLISSKPGKGGGYRLRRAASEINLSQILRLLDGPLAPVPCLSQTARKTCGDCPTHCVLRETLLPAHLAALKILEATTLEFMVREYHRLHALGGEFDIRI